MIPMHNKEKSQICLICCSKDKSARSVIASYLNLPLMNLTPNIWKRSLDSNSVQVTNLQYWR